MVSTNRWLGLALVAVLALVAQPAAVLDAPPDPASQMPEHDGTDCQVGEQIVDRELADAQALPETGELAICLEESGSVTLPTPVEKLTDIELG